NIASGDDDFIMYPVLEGLLTLSSTERYFTIPTPGAANNTTGPIGVVADTTFDVDRGFYNTPFDLSIHSDTAGAEIRSPPDGSAPTVSTGLVYTAPIHISGTAVVRAAAFKTGLLSSNVDTETYLFLSGVVNQSPDGSPPPGWPSSWGGNVVDYGMDPDIVNSPTYGPTIKNDLQTIPSLNLTMDL